ncbi:MAG: alkaline phosphatase D [Akkermansiaceae bacterium]|jgi:alkaline phosphatase D
MPEHPVEVLWEISEDDSFKKPVASGKVEATSALGFSVHIEAKDLKPDHWYSYRFQCGEATSVIGRTRTMPLPNDTPEKLRFAVTSCQHWEQGLFSAYQERVRDKPDFVFHLGDYIYVNPTTTSAALSTKRPSIPETPSSEMDSASGSSTHSNPRPALGTSSPNK